MGKETLFIFSRGFPVQQCARQNRHASQANKDYLLCPISAPPMEKRNTEKFRKVTLLHYSLPSPQQLARAWRGALILKRVAGDEREVRVKDDGNERRL